MKKQIIICANCNKKFSQYCSCIKNIERPCCNTTCRYELDRKIKYGHLYDTFRNNLDAVSYLCGLILGDGNLRKQPACKNTTRISIAFNAQQEYLISVFQNIAQILQLRYYIEPTIRTNCQMIGFALPDTLLLEYGMLWNGAKINANPQPIREIIQNINFAIGLINSDGHIKRKYKKRQAITFANTVTTIAGSFVHCLTHNNIHCTKYLRKGQVDKRTKRIGLACWIVDINKQKDILSLKTKTRFKIKTLP